MVTKKTDLNKPSKTISQRAPKKKTARSRSDAKGSHPQTIIDKESIKDLKTKIAELGRFASFPRLNPNPVLEVDSSGEILFINNAAKEILKKLHLERRSDIFLPKDIKTILKGLKHKKGKEIYREVTIQDRVFAERLYFAPEFQAVRIYAHDITESKKMETEIRQADISLSKERDFISAVLSTVGALVIVMDVKGRIIIFNKICEQLTGYTFDEVKGKPFWDILLVPEERKSVKTVFKELKAGKFPNKHENYWVAKDGTRCFITWSNTSLLDNKGEVEFIIGTGIDITAQRQAEEKLKTAYREVVNEKNSLEAVMKALPIGMALVDNLGGTIQANRAFEEIWGEPIPTAHCVEDYGQYKAWWVDTGKLLMPEEWASARAIQSGETVIGQILEIERFSGNRIFVYNSAAPIQNAEGKIIGSAVAIMDITALRRTEKALRESEEKFRSAFVEASIGFAMTTPDGCFVDANKAYCVITGYSLNELKILGFPKLIHPDDFAENMNMIDRMLAGKISDFVIENRYIRKGGSSVWVRKSVSLVRNAEHAPQWIIALIEDVTDRRQIEESLKHSEDDLNRAQAVASTGSWRLDVQKNELLWSDENHRIFGIPKGIQMTYETFLSIVHPDDRAYVDRKWKAALQGEPYDIEHRIVVKGHVKWVRERAELEFDKDGSLLGGFGTTQDISSRRLVEEELRLALNESQQRQNEISALLRGASAVLRHSNFIDAAQGIFNSCKDVVGAASGYIAMVSDDGMRNEVIYLDSGDLICTVDPDLPMPIRGLRGEVYSSGKTVFHNDFSRSEWAHFLPEGHVQLKNVLMAPMIVDNKVIGLFGLGNKTGGFTDNDVRIASAFSELAAIALVQKRAEEETRKAKDALQKANEQLENKVQERTEELSKSFEIMAAERQRFFSLLEELPGYVCLLTADYRFAYTNREFKRRFGDPGDRHCYKFLFDRENPCEMCRSFRVFSEQKAQQWEWTGPDGNTYAIFDYPFTDIDESPLILELGIDITRRKKAEQEVNESREKLRDLYAYFQDAVETEKKNIAREIHDEFGTILTALNIDLSWLEKKLPDDQHTLIERIHKDVELITSAIKVVQRISSELRPGVLDYLGFSSAVEWYVKEFAHRTGINWDIFIDMKHSDPGKNVEIALFRILQETLTNVARHAEASKIRVSVTDADNMLTLQVTDDGRGIMDDRLSDHRSYGIMGMKERVEYLGGDILIDGIPNKGTTVTVRVPRAGGE